MRNESEVKYPIGIQSFADIREGGYIYIDKTAYINMLKRGKYYFLARPRRFGKSLLLSTIEAYYQGKRELFRGLALETLTQEWDPHPVLHIDLNNREYKDENSLSEELNATFERWEEIYGDEKKDRAPEERLAYIIRKAYEKTGKKVVILIDEYDKPLLNTIHLPELSERYRSQLKAVYANLKTMDPYIEFAMLSGVARFSKVSIFSDLNNLYDISFDRRYAGICGITSEELEKYFQPGIRELGKTLGWSEGDVRKELKRRYDGYHFTEVSPDIYNPYSLMCVLEEKEISDHWFMTGTPTFLVRLMEAGGMEFRKFTPVEIEKSDLRSAGILSNDPVPAFYQTGYLTIKGTDNKFNTYILDYPNEEVKNAFLRYLMHSYIPATEVNRAFAIREFVRDVNDGKVETFMKRLESLIASIPYNEKGTGENHFQNAIYLIFTLMGYFARMEDRTSDGRIDIQVTTPNYIYIFEFKIDSSAAKAINQIREKKYWLRESFSGKNIFLVGANFDTSTRRLNDFIIQHP